MRILLAKWLAVATGVLIVALATLFALTRNPAEDATPPAAIEDVSAGPRVVEVPAGAGANVGDPSGPTARGRAVYGDQRCAMCHSIGNEGNTRSPLDDVGSRLTEEQIRRWIVTPQEMDPAVRKRGYKLPPEDLDALVMYLLSRP